MWRISVGGAIAGATWGGFARAARRLAAGHFDGFGQNLARAEPNGTFGGPA